MKSLTDCSYRDEKKSGERKSIFLPSSFLWLRALLFHFPFFYVEFVLGFKPPLAKSEVPEKRFTTFPLSETAVSLHLGLHIVS